MDYLSAMISSITQGLEKRRLVVTVKGTKHNISILRSLELCGYIRGFKKLDSGNCEVLLKYSGGFPVIQSLTRVSKRSKRVYVGKGDSKLRYASQGSCYLISTSSGVVSTLDSTVSNSAVGGEVLLKVN